MMVKSGDILYINKFLNTFFQSTTACLTLPAHVEFEREALILALSQSLSQGMCLCALRRTEHPDLRATLSSWFQNGCVGRQKRGLSEVFKSCVFRAPSKPHLAFSKVKISPLYCPVRAVFDVSC